jgi:protein ImuA
MFAAAYPPSALSATPAPALGARGFPQEHFMHANLGHFPSRAQASFGTLRNPLISKSIMPHEPRPHRLASTSVQELKARLAAFETRADRAETAALPFGIDAIDTTLPGGGLARAALHEIAGAANDGAAAGFAAALLARLAADGPVLWIARRPDLSAAGLASLGLEPARLLFVNAPRRADALWAFEEALRTPALAGVVAEIDGVDLTQTRRLQLAAEMGRTTALLLRPADELRQPSAARTRWHIAAEPAGDDAPRWRVELARAQGGGPAAWSLTAPTRSALGAWKLADDSAKPPVAGDRVALSAGRTLRTAG